MNNSPVLVFLLLIVAAVGGRLGGMQGFILILIALIGGLWAAGAPIERILRILFTGG